jgi:hypothetical protein
MRSSPRAVALPLAASWAAVVTASLFGCRTGVNDVSIGFDVSSANEYYLSPSGSDANSGARDRPWRSFRFAVPRLQPGDTLILLDGVYQRATTGYPDIRCDAGASNGTASRSITLRADHERAALLDGDGRSPSFFMQSCAFWVVDGLRARSVDAADAPMTPDAGSVFALGNDNHHVVLRRLLASHPNRFRHTHGVRIGEASSDVLVEECEVYDYHQNAFETSRTTAVEFRRNYSHSRQAADVPGGFATEDPTRGDVGVLMEETRFALAENNIAESAKTGVRVMGRSDVVPSDLPALATDPVTGNRMLGNVVISPSDSGYRIDSRCMGHVPCAEATRFPVDTELTDNVAVGGPAGVSSSGAVGTRISQFTSVGANVGISIVVTSDNVGLRSDSSTVNALAVGFDTAGFRSVGEVAWGFDHCAVAGTAGQPFVPMDTHITSPIVADSAQGTCPVAIPAGSPLKGAGAGGHDVGGNASGRYEGGVLTVSRLWDPNTGAFPCGAAVAGLNDDPATSCMGVHQRLHVGSSGCAVP